MLKKFLANVLFMLVVALLAVEYTNKNPYIFVGVTSGILANGLYRWIDFYRHG